MHEVSTAPRPAAASNLRELTLPDGRRAMVDRRGLSFLCEGKAAEFGDRPVVIVGFRTAARPIPALGSFAELAAWWRAGESGRAAARPARQGR